MQQNILREVRTSKPPIGTPIDWSNPLTQGLVGAWAFNEGGGKAFESVTQLPPTTWDGTVYWQPTGLNTTSRANKTFNCPKVNDTNRTSGLTIVARTNHSSPYFGGVVISSNENNNGSGFTFGVDDYNNISNGLFLKLPTAGTIFTPSGFLGANSAGRFSTYAVSLLNTEVSFFCHGRLPHLTTIATPSLEGGSGRITRLFGDQAVEGGLCGLTDYIFVFNRALSSAKIASLSANPWQIYEPKKHFQRTGNPYEIFPNDAARLTPSSINYSYKPRR